jgi:hypothetical protein
MTNGDNNWGVPYSQITWFERLLQNHKNVTNIGRTRDILFEVDRKAQRDHLRILCCREYTMSLATVQRGLHEFESINVFYIGGAWCGYTRQAKEFCILQQIGLFITDEMTGALWKDDYWNYNQRDDKGDPIYRYRVG